VRAKSFAVLAAISALTISTTLAEESASIDTGRRDRKTAGDSRGLGGATDLAEIRALATEVARHISLLLNLDAGSIPAASANLRFWPEIRVSRESLAHDNVHIDPFGLAGHGLRTRKHALASLQASI
jgi:hypothetical protein